LIDSVAVIRNGSENSDARELNCKCGMQAEIGLKDAITRSQMDRQKSRKIPGTDFMMLGATRGVIRKDVHSALAGQLLVRRRTGLIASA
jgi:hypothetical protein